MRGQIEKKTYLQIIGGKVVERLGKTEKREAELNPELLKKNYPDYNRVRESFKDGNFYKTFIERADDFVEGTIQKIYFQDTDYGERLAIMLNDGFENFILQLPSEGANARIFMMCLPNINLKKPVKFTPWKNVQRKQEGLILSQDGKRVEYFWTKDNPKDYPQPPEWTKKTPYEEWTAAQKREYKKFQLDRNGFLHDYTEEIASHISPEDTPAPEQQAADKLKDAGFEPPAEPDTKKEDYNDDLPF